MTYENLDLVAASSMIASGELSAVDLMAETLNRIESNRDRLNCFSHVDVAGSIQAAEQANKEIDDGAYRGPLHGIPVGIKDMIDVEGMPTTASSKVLSRQARADAHCVQQLRDAGAILVGKTQTHEFAYGVTTPQTVNPRDQSRTAGGSSGGSAAALAAGECLLALGTDTAGSIRIPAAACGVAGLKPTFGAVSRQGVQALSWSLDHLGPLTRSTRDAAVAFGVLAAHDPRDTGSYARDAAAQSKPIGAVRGLKLGVVENYLDASETSVSSSVRSAIDRLEAGGAELISMQLPSPEQLIPVMFGLILPEASTIHQTMLREKADFYGFDVRVFLEAGELLPATTYLNALRARQVVKEQIRQAFGDCDALIMPTLPIPTPRAGENETVLANGATTTVLAAFVGHSAPASLAGLPALSVPCGHDSNHNPVGLQIIGRPFGEQVLFDIGVASESEFKMSTQPG